MIGKRLRKIIRTLLLICYILKKKKYAQLCLLKIDLNCEKQIILLMIPKKDKKGWHYLPVKKKISGVLRGITPRLFLLLKLSLFFCTLNQMKKYEKIKPFVKM